MGTMEYLPARNSPRTTGGNMSFEDIPEDVRQGYPCPDCEDGSVTLNFDATKWECDTCNYESTLQEAE